MLQMTTLELSELIQQQMTENPVLEEVATQEEARELAEKILDHMASGGELEHFDAPTVEANAPETGEPSSNGVGETDGTTFTAVDFEVDPAGPEVENGMGEAGDDVSAEASRDSFEEVRFWP